MLRRRTAPAAALVVADVMDRWLNNYSGHGVGLRGGTLLRRATRSRGSGSTASSSSTASGSAAPPCGTATAKTVAVDLRVQGRGPDGHLRGTWDTRAEGATAVLRGRLDGNTCGWPSRRRDLPPVRHDGDGRRGRSCSCAGRACSCSARCCSAPDPDPSTGGDSVIAPILQQGVAAINRVNRRLPREVAMHVPDGFLDAQTSVADRGRRGSGCRARTAGSASRARRPDRAPRGPRGHLHLRDPDAQLPGRLRHQRTSPGRSTGGRAGRPRHRAALHERGLPACSACSSPTGGSRPWARTSS